MLQAVSDWVVKDPCVLHWGTKPKASLPQHGAPKGAGMAADRFNCILRGLLAENVRPEIPMSALILEIG